MGDLGVWGPGCGRPGLEGPGFVQPVQPFSVCNLSVCATCANMKAGWEKKALSKSNQIFSRFDCRNNLLSSLPAGDYAECCD